MSQRVELTISIVNWNTTKLLRNCLNSIFDRSLDFSFEVLVVDNNSQDEDVDLIRQTFSKYQNFKLIKNKKNIGCLAFNQAFRVSQGKYFLFLGPDTILLENCLEEMVDFLRRNPQAGGVTAKILNPDKTLQFYFRNHWSLFQFFFLKTWLGNQINRIFKNQLALPKIDPEKISEIEQPPGVCLMIKKKALGEDQDPIDPQFPFYFPDPDICKRIWKNGFKIYFLPQAKVIHFRGAAFSQLDSGWKEKEYLKSAIFYFKKHHPNRAMFLKFLIILDQIVWLVLSPIITPTLMGEKVSRKKMLKVRLEILKNLLFPKT